MPVDRNARKELAKCLELLVSGQMTNDEFDRFYYDDWENNGDRAVQSVAGFGYCLYSSDLPSAYKLKGWHAVSNDVREIADQSVLFLRSDLEYEWPDATYSGLPGCCLYYGFILFVVSLFIGILGLFTKDFPWLFVSPLFAMVFLLAIVGFIESRENSERHKSFCQYGDADVWPFLRRSDYDRVRTGVEAEDRSLR
jgi:hypothetical protein